jgi:DNA polymerase-3 subunit epsilon
MDAAEDLVFVDLETTGTGAAYDRITEVGIVRLDHGGVVEEWSSLVNPECPIPEHIEGFTGISNAMVADAPRFAEIAPLLQRKLRGAVFVAHNARFDYSFLRAEFRRLDVDFRAVVLCTVKLSRRLFPDHVRHNLDIVMQRNGITCSARHRALGDAKVLHDLWSKWRREVAESTFEAAVRGVLGAHRLPAHLPDGTADDLPDGAGVYRFFGDGDELLYVGRAKSLRTTICGRLAATEGTLADRVRRIDWRETCGEIGAMLCETEWLRERHPPFNRRARTAARFHTLRAGAASIAAVPVDGLESAALRECFGTFHGAKDAQRALCDIARAHRLCLKVLGFEDGPGSCVAYQVGGCKGACVGGEPPPLHRLRVLLALAPLKLRSWPFRGRIALREGRHAAELHVFDQWAYIGTARTEEELGELASRPADMEFRADVYRLLVRYFARNPRLDCIHLDRAGANAIGGEARYNVAPGTASAHTTHGDF